MNEIGMRRGRLCDVGLGGYEEQAKAIGKDWSMVVDVEDFEVAAVIPHPSGIVLWWNDPENRKRAGMFLRECLMTVDRNEIDEE